jgi:hypothetical protein
MSFLDQLSGRYGDAYLAELASVVEKFAPEARRFLEWGSGESTRLFCSIASTRSDPLVISIDNDRDYIQSVSESLPLHPFLHFRCLDLQGPSLNQQDQLPSYASYPFFINLEFDVVFIDGRRRMECALTTSQILSDGGIVILHDWRRSRYAAIRTLFTTVYEGEQFLVLRPLPGIKRRRPVQVTNERRAVIVIVRGRRAELESEITLPWTKAYAHRVGAECIVIGQSSTLPRQRLKYEALRVAQSYDRILLLDADVIIRPDSPDLFNMVPSECLGAFPEGAYFPRQEWCQELGELYHLNGTLRPEEYFNSGVLIMSPATYALLQRLENDVIFGHPQFEQGALNAWRVDLDIPLFALPPDMNYIPEAFFPADWRYGFFIHLAGSGKKKYLYDTIWEDLTGDRHTFSKRTFLSAYIRITLVRAVSQQMQGRDVQYFDATDFQYGGGFPLMDVAGDVIAYFAPAGRVDSKGFSLWGPYAKLAPGNWVADFIGLKMQHMPERGLLVEITMKQGTQQLLPEREMPEDGRLEFVVETYAEDVEFRMRRVSAALFEFCHLRLERHDDHKSERAA